MTTNHFSQVYHALDDNMLNLFNFQAVFPLQMYAASNGGAFNVCSNDLAAATVAEVIMTTLLTVVVCMGAINSQTRSPLAPFCIGLTVTVNIFAG